MEPDDPRIDDLVAAVAEGRLVDWTALLASCRDDENRNLVAQLKVLAQIARTTDPSSAEEDGGHEPDERSLPASHLFRWGQLEVIEELGRGAFGRVLRARDPRLDREVALKVFDRAAIGDGELIREAQLLARIRHPHVVVVHGADTIDGSTGLWMELVRGRTLHQVLRDSGPFGPREAAIVGLDLCSALAAVHGVGLVHRDIKASNVMRETGGRVVLMDFGAGLQRDDRDRSDGIGTGTPLYMAPELFDGADASVSTDLYALGVLLFHLVAGVYPVNGPSLGELRECHARGARTLLRDARPDIPAGLAHVVDRALSPVPAERFRSAADMERALAATLDIERAAPVTDATRSWWRRSATRALPAWMTLAAIAIAVAATLFGAARFEHPFPTHTDQAVSPGSIAFGIEPPDTLRFAEGAGLVAVSPDGRRIAFSTMSNQVSSTPPSGLWVRPLGSLVAEPVPGAGAAGLPFWSPDGRFMGFSTSSSTLKRVDVNGGSVVTLADWGLGGTWNAEGVVLFSGRDGRIFRISGDGGEPVPMTTLDRARNETDHLWPFFLPDGRRFLFSAVTSSFEGALYVGSLDSPARTHIANVASKAEYANGFLFYQRQGTLMAHRFDEQKARLVGEAKPIATSVRFEFGGRSAFSVSRTGVVAYLTDAGSLNALTWFDRNGKRLAAVGEAGKYAYASLSPDGTRLAVNRQSDDGRFDLWVVDLTRNLSMRFTFNNMTTFWPVVWSPDAAHLVFAAQDTSLAYNLYRRSVIGASSDERLFASGDDKEPTAFSPDGGILLFNRELGKGHGTDIWALPLAGDRKPFALFESPYSEESAVFSPDGRWIAYTSDESGVFQIYAQPFPATGVKVQISRDGGAWPRWTTDGRIVYSSENRLWSATVTETGGTLRAGAPTALFSQTFIGSRFGSFSVDRSGNRVLLIVPQEAEPSSLKVLVNPLGAAAPVSR